MILEMKKLSLFVIIGMLLVLSSCGNSAKYCNVSGCPSETYYGHKYCYRHKCFNDSCENQSYINGYCKECLERAIK